MLPNPQFPADLVTFTEETLNGKLHFFCAVDAYESFDIVNPYELCVILKKFKRKVKVTQSQSNGNGLNSHMIN